jgi:succinate dehydrogenase/fumarate reductase flavoprotein subunit
MLAAIAERVGGETRFFEELGVPFARRDGKLARRQAAGVSWPRAVYTLDMVGLDAGKRLTQRLREAGSPAVRLLEGGFLLELDLRDGRVGGGLVYVHPERRWLHVAASAVILATGGAGQLFAKTTNFPGTQGIGYALGLEAGASLVDMEFVSFEPTVSVGPAAIAGMELPTMAFSDGARLLNGRGQEFLRTAPPPSKDVMSRAMLQEVREGRGTPGGAIYYDLRGMTEEAALGYSQIRRVLNALGMTSQAAQIEVLPTQHFLMGGIATDERGAADVPGLYAVGEVAGGAHGAHRLATCGGTEVIAMGAIAGEAAAAHASERGLPPTDQTGSTPKPELLQVSMDASDRVRFQRLQRALEGGCGVWRDPQGLRACLEELGRLRDELRGERRMQTFVGRAVLVAQSIAVAGLARVESRGDHFRTDHPRRDDRHWFGNLRVRLEAGSADLTLAYQKAGIGLRETAALPR